MVTCRQQLNKITFLSSDCILSIRCLTSNAYSSPAVEGSLYLPANMSGNIAYSVSTKDYHQLYTLYILIKYMYMLNIQQC